MCHTRLEALANVLHHWELFIVCLNCLPLNSPFIHFITSQRAGTLKGAQLHHYCVKLHWSRAACLGTQSTPSTLRLKSMDAHTVHSMYVFKVKHSGGACKMLLCWSVLEQSSASPAALRVLLYSRPWPLTSLWNGRQSFPTGIKKLSHHSASNMLNRQLPWLYLPVRLLTLCQLCFVFTAVDSCSCFL